MPASSSNFALSAPGIFADRCRCTEVMAKPSPCFSSVTSALVSICSAVSLASPRISDSAIVKQAACAAPISSSGLEPGLPSKRLAEAAGESLKAPLFVGITPLPSLIPPCHLADPNVVVMGMLLHRRWELHFGGGLRQRHVFS